MGMHSFFDAIASRPGVALDSLNPNRDSHRASRFERVALLFAFILIAVSSTTSAAQNGTLPNAALIVQPQAYVSLQPVPRGSAFEVAVVGKISPGFHVNAHEPSEEYLIPTKITAELPPGVNLVETTYPRGVMRGFRFSKTQLRVYEGSFTVRMKFRAGSTAAMGRQKLALTLGYQACNQDACLPPTKVPATAQIEIASADSPAHRSSDPVFSSAPAVKFPTMKR